MILLIDNYDSFTFNLVQRFGEIDPSLHIEVVRNDQITAQAAEDRAQDRRRRRRRHDCGKQARGVRVYSRRRHYATTAWWNHTAVPQRTPKPTGVHAIPTHTARVDGREWQPQGDVHAAQRRRRPDGPIRHAAGGTSVRSTCRTLDDSTSYSYHVRLTPATRVPNTNVHATRE